MPLQLHAALKRGKTRSGEAAKRMSVDEFLRRVAEREGTQPERAREHARAVLATLREAVDEEFFDIRVQLPDEYSVLLAPR